MRHFTNLDEFREELERLDRQRKADTVRVEEHFEAMQEPGFRKALIGNTVSEAWSSMAPKGLLGMLVGKGSVGTGLSFALGANKASLGKRILLFMLGTVAPSLMGKLDGFSLDGLRQELGTSFDRVKHYVQQRISAKHEA